MTVKASAERSRTPVKAPVRVLIVDDDSVVRRLVALTLLDEGYEVHTASNGAEALDMAADVVPDVIVLDLEMPQVDGRACYRELRARGHQAPVLVLSAYGAHQARRELGAQGAMDKPFDPFELLRRLERLIPSQP